MSLDALDSASARRLAEARSRSSNINAMRCALRDPTPGNTCSDFCNSSNIGLKLFMRLKRKDCRPWESHPSSRPFWLASAFRLLVGFVHRLEQILQDRLILAVHTVVNVNREHIAFPFIRTDTRPTPASPTTSSLSTASCCSLNFSCIAAFGPLSLACSCCQTLFARFDGIESIRHQTAIATIHCGFTLEIHLRLD